MTTKQPMKHCLKCRGFHDVGDFGPSAESDDGLSSWCKKAWESYTHNQCKKPIRGPLTGEDIRRFGIHDEPLRPRQLTHWQRNRAVGGIS